MKYFPLIAVGIRSLNFFLKFLYSEEKLNLQLPALRY